MKLDIRNNQKKTIVVSACVVFALLLIIALIMTLVSLSSASSRKNRLQQQLDSINAQIELNDSNIEYYQSDDYIQRVAREYLDMQGKDEITFVGK